MYQNCNLVVNGSFWFCFRTLGEEKTRPICRYPSACPSSPCRRRGKAWRPSKPPEGRGQIENDEEKKEDGDGDEEMEGKRTDEEDMQHRLVVEEGLLINLPLVPLPFVSFPCSSCFKVLSAKKKLNNHIVNMHKDPTSFKLC